MFFKKGISRKERIAILKRFSAIIFGNIILAFGTAIFFLQCDIVAGGLSGIGIVVKSLFNFDEDVTIFILQWVLFFIGFAFLGKRFAFETLIATIVFPLATMLFTRVITPDTISFLRLANDNTTRLLAAIFGGVLTGVGVAMNMVGGGSTGGVDILAILLRKITRIKTSIWVFVIDASIIILGMIFSGGNEPLFAGMIGILAALMCSLIVEIFFSKQNNCYVANIISPQWEKINKYIQDDMKRGATIIPVQGGYQFNEYRMVQVAFARKEQSDLLLYISEVDPNAFVTIVRAHEINGEGFMDLPKIRKRQK